MANLSGDAKQTYVADLFSRIAHRYDLMNSLMTGGMHHRWKRVAALTAAEGLAGPALDVATGTGDLAFTLAEQPSIERVVGVDLLPEMLALAKSKGRKKEQVGSTLFLQGDALRLPFPDGTFACATAGFSLRNMPDLTLAIAEMARVVRPGGRVTTLELTPMDTGLKAGLFRLYFHNLVPLIGQVVAGNRSAYTYLPQSVDYFLQADRLAELYAQIGLTEVGYLKLGFGTVAIHYGTKPSG